MRLLFVGTTSNAGKTLMTALFCRYLRRKMIMVAPFKALNLSSTSFRTADGDEIGTGQALQAWASDIEPDVRMNPVLLKAEDGKLKLLLNGRETGRMPRKELLAHAVASYDELCDMYEAVVAEGSGSAAEINLRDHDIANVGFAAERQIPMVLIGNIERGGVFAGLYGTWRLIEEKNRHLLKGFIINKYYGDKDILRSGIERIESLTGMRCFGVMPHVNVRLPEEDSSEDGIRTYSDDEINSFIGSLDSILDTANENIDMHSIFRVTSE
ncbi:MAG: AAA family ATPase [Methanomassiliicoccaceae archaeon]|nr:AAA family ATPase [Methanomassiliicoccaceae archaeon]